MIITKYTSVSNCFKKLFFLENFTPEEYKQYNYFNEDHSGFSKQTRNILTVAELNNSFGSKQMDDKFHIIVTKEYGRSLSMQLSRKVFYLSSGFTALFIIALLVFSYETTGSYFSNKLLNKKVNTLQAELDQSQAAACDITEELEALKKKHAEQIAAINAAHQEKLDDQQMAFDLENTNLQLENIRLMTTAVNDLNQRSELIEDVMGMIGVEIKNTQKNDKPLPNSGGPYIPAEDAAYDDLLKQVDKYVETVKKLPLGKPLPGRISSGFGKRVDPLNGKKSMHEGIDIKGERGDRIRATASGKVIKATKNGSFGNYVEIDHGNGYITAYAHMQNYLVRKGEWVEQGQIIGQVGSSGRSTGPHLHYEIHLNKRPVNPKKFTKVADISRTFPAKKDIN